MIDAHQHFWKRERGDYEWLSEEPKILQRDYLPSDLKPLLDTCGIQKTILVQAAETIEETLFILDLAERHDWLAGVVGWIDFDSNYAIADLEKLCDHPKLLGIRPILQGIEDTNWILAPHRIDILKHLSALNKTFDALVLPRHLAVLPDLLAQVPQLPMVIDHGAKPFIANGVLSPWDIEMVQIAKHPNVYCKLSGLVTEAALNWDVNHLQPFMQHLLTCFGPDRLMWGSDWPVLNCASDYKNWHSIALNFCQQNAPEHIEDIFSNNAARFYGLEGARHA